MPTIMEKGREAYIKAKQMSDKRKELAIQNRSKFIGNLGIDEKLLEYGESNDSAYLIIKAPNRKIKVYFYAGDDVSHLGMIDDRPVRWIYMEDLALDIYESFLP